MFEKSIFTIWEVLLGEVRKHPKGAGTKVAPFEAFYRNIRRMGAAHLDPLVQQQDVEEDEEEQVHDKSTWGSITREARRSQRDTWVADPWQRDAVFGDSEITQVSCILVDPLGLLLAAQVL
eukprot:3468289-Amphidinium_carterae.1